MEWLTALHYLTPHLSKKKTIADIGCATGAYCLELASKVNNIIAVDLIPRHIEQLEKTIKDNGISNIASFVGSACNLDMIPDSSVDIAVFFGPLYHIQKNSDRKIAIGEAYRVLKPGGLFFASYINKKQTVFYFTKYGKEFDDGQLKAFENNEYHKLVGFDDFLSISYCTNPDDIEKEIKQNGFAIEKHVSLDSIAYFLSEELERLSESGWSAFVNYHFRTCENEKSLEMSSHGLVIGKKN